MLVDGTNVLAIQGHNRSLSSSDFSLLPSLGSNLREHVAPGAAWRYFKGREEPPADWPERDFDDHEWARGASGFGYGDDDDSTVLDDMRGNYLSLYIRTSFEVDDRSAIDRAILSVDYDDGFVAYLNGRLVAQANVLGVPPSHLATADLDHEAGVPLRYAIAPNQLVQGTNVLAIQGHNAPDDSSDFSLTPTLAVLTSDRYQLIGAGDIAGCTNSGDEETAILLGEALASAEDGQSMIFTAGDNAYEHGAAEDFENCYDPS
jgi:hypothetical protein